MEIRLKYRCPMSWDDLAPVEGAATLRHCSVCQKNVHNLSAMTEKEARAFLAAQDPASPPCVFFLRGKDGRALTRGCPEAEALPGNPARRIAASAAAATALALASCGSGSGPESGYGPFDRATMGVLAFPDPGEKNATAHPAPATSVPLPPPESG